MPYCLFHQSNLFACNCKDEKDCNHESNHDYDYFCNVIKYDYLALLTNVIDYECRISQNSCPRLQQVRLQSTFSRLLHLCLTPTATHGKTNSVKVQTDESTHQTDLQQH